MRCQYWLRTRLQRCFHVSDRLNSHSSGKPWMARRCVCGIPMTGVAMEDNDVQAQKVNCNTAMLFCCRRECSPTKNFLLQIYSYDLCTMRVQLSSPRWRHRVASRPKVPKAPNNPPHGSALQALARDDARRTSEGSTLGGHFGIATLSWAYAMRLLRAAQPKA